MAVPRKCCYSGAFHYGLRSGLYRKRLFGLYYGIPCAVGGPPERAPLIRNCPSRWLIFAALLGVSCASVSERDPSGLPEEVVGDRAAFESASKITDPREKREAMRLFLERFPKSSYEDQAVFAIAELARTRQQRIEELKSFVQSYSRSPLRDQAYFSILALSLASAPIDEEALLSVIDEYLASLPSESVALEGGRVDRRGLVLNNIADSLMTKNVLLDKALELMDEALSTTSQSTPLSIESMYRTTRGQVLFQRKEYKEAERSLRQAIETVGEEHTADAFFYLGKTLEATSRLEEAISAYLESLKHTHRMDSLGPLRRAYRKKHGNLEQLHARLDAALLSRQEPVAAGRYQRTDEEGPQRTVLAEFFTGAQCSPCVASDLALESLLRRYDHETLVLVQYHVHMPGLDPMTNPDSERRALYYSVGGTPMTFVDGRGTGLAGGSLGAVGKSFDSHKAIIEERVAIRPSAELLGTTLERGLDYMDVSGMLKIPADIMDEMPNLRLRLIVVEKTVHYTGANGVHFHQFVARKLLGPSSGIQISQQETPFHATVAIADLRVELGRYIEGYRRLVDGFQWPDVVLPIDEKQLSVIAVVQNDSSREVLQTKLIGLNLE